MSNEELLAKVAVSLVVGTFVDLVDLGNDTVNAIGGNSQLHTRRHKKTPVSLHFILSTQLVDNLVIPFSCYLVVLLAYRGRQKIEMNLAFSGMTDSAAPVLFCRYLTYLCRGVKTDYLI